MDALLIGYESQENLGLRSITAYLLERGYQVAIIPFSPGQYTEILRVVIEQQPRLVGFSLIFQFTLEEFGRLLKILREGDVQAHFTAGGHFPSLRPQDTLELLPQLDSVVRFEGEQTLADLLDHLDQPETWEHIQGLAFRSGTSYMITSPRPLIDNLDMLPFVHRDESNNEHFGIKSAAMLASRGCLFNCSFCSIRQFYGGTPGQLRRVRSPNSVVEEMSMLVRTKEVSFFSFQDDDFAARTPRQREWLLEFLRALEEAHLADKIGWKISCRVDDLESSIMEKMVKHGLMAVYLGVESGSQAGLEVLNKHVSVAQNLKAIEILKNFEIALGMGFMLFDPASTVDTIWENLNFLRTVGQDGYFPINFCKMLPYAGTPIEAELRRTGRLTGTITTPDYNFMDEQMDWYAFLVQRIFARRNFQADGIVERLQEADFNFRLGQKFGLMGIENGMGVKIRELIKQSNKLALTTLEKLLKGIKNSTIENLLANNDFLPNLAEREWRGEDQIEIELRQLLLKFLSDIHIQP